MLKPRFLIGFTGHRAGFDENLIRSGLKCALEDLKQRASKADGGVDLYASIAEGADTLCVEVAREIGMAVHLLLPLPQDEFAKDFSVPTARERSLKQIDLASQKPGRDSVRIVPGEMIRPDCYFDQGIQILEAVDVLLAVWDGEPARGLGGTAQIIAHAQKLGLPVLVIDAKTGQTRTEGDWVKVFAPDQMVAELYKMAHLTGAA